VARGQVTTLKERWGVFVAIAALPLLAPARGIASTLLTGFCVVFATRLPDLERERPRKTRSELWLWLLVPMFRAWSSTAGGRARNRAAAKTHARAALKYAVLYALVVAALYGFGPGRSVPNLIRSSTLILFFVGLIVGLAEGLTALTALLGANVDVLFDAPLDSRSLREFWGRRWNRFIARFALRHIATSRPSRDTRRLFSSSASRTLLVFFWSALFHEYFAWGVAGNVDALGTMFSFFVLQGLLMTLLPLWPATWPLPSRVGQALTFGWMAATAPLFFESTSAPLVALGYPESWLPDGLAYQVERIWSP